MIKNGYEFVDLFFYQKMNPEMWAIAISNILFGFVAGLAVEGVMSAARRNVFTATVQKAVEVMFQKDQKIDELNSELQALKNQYSELYEATEASRRAFERVKNLPPPSLPLTRCEHYVEENVSNIDFPNPQTPTCVPSSMD